MDDLLFYGKDSKHYDANVNIVLNKLVDNGVTLNAEKCLFGHSSVEFLGHIVSAEGIEPIRRKLDAI